MEHDIHIIQNLLNERELSMITMVLSQLSFRDGSGTASDAARAVKNNLQVVSSLLSIQSRTIFSFTSITRTICLLNR